MHSCFIGSIWGSDLPDMQLISGFDKGTCFLLCVIDIFSNYAWLLHLKHKSSIMITNAYKFFLKESNCKPYKIWVDKGSEFYSRSMKSWLDKNDMEIYSAHSKG